MTKCLLFKWLLTFGVISEYTLHRIVTTVHQIVALLMKKMRKPEKKLFGITTLVLCGIVTRSYDSVHYQSF